MKLRVVVGTILATAVTLGLFLNTANTKERKDVISLRKDNFVLIRGAIAPETAGAIISKARALDASLSRNEPLYIFLQTPGGNIETGFEIIETLKSFKRPVHTVTAFSASMGFQLVQQLGERNILSTGVLMSHRAAGGFEGSFGGTYPSQLDSRYEMWKQRVLEMDLVTVKRTKGKQTLESYTKAYANEMWLTGDQAVAQGYADQVVTVSCDNSLLGSMVQNVNFLGLNIAVEFDSCPTNTSPMSIKVNIATPNGMIDSDTFISKGGRFSDVTCNTPASLNRICALDPRLNVDVINDVKNKYLIQYKGR